jgi:uncharacterized protein
MRILLAGASGFLGTAWRRHLDREGHEVVRLVRGEPSGAGESRWDPYAGQLDASLLEDVDVVANLAGAPLAHWPWTPSYKRTFLDSRVLTTRTLAEAIAHSGRKPAFVAQNGVAGYGDRGDLTLTEESTADASTFMGRVTVLWEQATTAAAQAGARVVVMRTGIVLDHAGSALRPLVPLFRAGLGGPIGSGKQYFPTISLRDWVRAATYLATTASASGVYNVTGPNATTNAEFTAEMARMLHRPALVRAPAWAVRKVLGEVSSELLGSARVEPARLEQEGFVFEDRTLNERLAAALT